MPKTREADEMKNAIIIAGERFETPFSTNLTSSFRGIATRARRHTPTCLAVMHWDVAGSSASAYRSMVRSTRRGKPVSCHFAVDADGTVHQWADPGVEVTYHAGSPANDLAYAGIEINNPVRVGKDPRRKTYTGLVHGARKEWAGALPVQLRSLMGLLRVLSDASGLAMHFQSGHDVIPDALKKGGVLQHLHLTRGKWDHAGLVWQLQEEGWL
jgi:hypothetical protein